MAIEVFNRYEHKYMLDRSEFVAMTRALQQYMVPDCHNGNGRGYTISNIYYDTDDDYLIRTSLSKPDYKEKLRLRSYKTATAGDKVFLEVKKKYRGLVNKRRSAFELGDAYKFLETGQIPAQKSYMNMQVLREIEYFLSFYSVRPKVYLAYDRLAYFEKDNNDLRISFDFNIRSRRHDVRLENDAASRRLFADGIYLMEIKTSLAKPLWLTSILAELGIRRTSFSKYGTEFVRYMREETNEIKSVI